MKRPPVKFFVIAGLIVLLAAWNHFRESDQRQLLVAEGFVVSAELESSPAILISESRQQLAVLYPDGFVRTGFGEVASVAVDIQLNKQQEPINRQLVIILKGSSPAEWRVHFKDDQQLEQAKNTLDSLIFN